MDREIVTQSYLTETFCNQMCNVRYRHLDVQLLHLKHARHAVCPNEWTALPSVSYVVCYAHEKKMRRNIVQLATTTTDVIGRTGKLTIIQRDAVNMRSIFFEIFTKDNPQLAPSYAFP